MIDSKARSAMGVLDPSRGIRSFFIVLVGFGVLLLVSRDVSAILFGLVVLASIEAVALGYVYGWRLSRRVAGRALGFPGDPVWLLGVALRRGHHDEADAAPAVPRPEPDWSGFGASPARLRLLAIFASGSLGRLLLFTPLLLFGLRVGLTTLVGNVLFFAGGFGLALTLPDVYPRRLGVRLSDGASILALFRRPEQEDAPIVYQALRLQWERGKRPKDWQPVVLWQARGVLAGFEQKPGHDPALAEALNASLYYHAIDSGRQDEATLYLSRALREKEQLPAESLDELLREAAFFAARCRNSPLAGRRWLGQARPGTGDQRTAARAEAAVLLAEGHYLEAISAAERGLAVPLGRRPGGIALWEREQLEQIRGDAEAASVAALALPA